MPMPNRNGLDMVHLNVHMKDATTSGAGLCHAGIASPIRGRLVRVKAIAQGTVSGTASATLTRINTTTVTGGTISFVSGIAAGAVYSADTTNSPIVQQGDVINFLSNAAGTDETVAVTFQVSIRKI